MRGPILPHPKTRFQRDMNDVIHGYVLTILMLIITYLIYYGNLFLNINEYVVGALVMGLLINVISTMNDHHDFKNRVENRDYEILKEGSDDE